MQLNLHGTDSGGGDCTSGISERIHEVKGDWEAGGGEHDLPAGKRESSQSCHQASRRTSELVEIIPMVFDLPNPKIP